MPGIASAYRAVSLTALTWLVGLEVYRFANKNYTPEVDTARGDENAGRGAGAAGIGFG